MIEPLDLILKGKKEIIFTKDCFAVYFLLKKDKIVYIGSSENFLLRVGSHLKDKDFDSFYYVQLKNKEEMLKTEAENIIYYNPLYNKNLPESYISLSYLKNVLLKKGYRIDLKQLKQVIKQLNIRVSVYDFTIYIPKEKLQDIFTYIQGDIDAKK